jgi:hypothetical protein
LIRGHALKKKESMLSSSIARVVFVAMALGVTSCASTVETVHASAPMHGGARWVILPVANYAESPRAGERVEAMLDTVLRRDGVASLERYPASKDDDAHLVTSDRQRYDEALTWARAQRFDYAVAGSVEEWRYKGGDGGEPAVGLTVVVTELPSGRVVWSGSGTRTGTSGDNASGTALRLLDALASEMRVVP